MGVKAILAPNSSFCHWQKSFSRPLFWDFSRPLFCLVKNMVSCQKFQEFPRVFLLLTGRIFDFFHAHYFSFHGRNFRKFSRVLFGAFSVFFTGTFFLSRSKFQNSTKIFTGDFFFFTPKKNTVSRK